MSKEECLECEFIQEAMRFYTYNDFVRDKWSLKRLYNVLNCKRFYKWYVYSHCNISEKRLDEIWEFLNNEEMNLIYENEDTCIDN